jgi:hypothetical protein
MRRQMHAEVLLGYLKVRCQLEDLDIDGMLLNGSERLWIGGCG